MKLNILFHWIFQASFLVMCNKIDKSIISIYLKMAITINQQIISQYGNDEHALITSNKQWENGV